jgi:hypothetical protein
MPPISLFRNKQAHVALNTRILSYRPLFCYVVTDMKHSIVLSMALTIIVVLAITVVSGCTATATVEDLGAGLLNNSSYSIQVIGGTNGTVTLSYLDIVALGLVKMDNVSHPNNEGLTVSDNYIGVPLIKILEKAGLPTGDSAGDYAYNVTGLGGYYAVYDQNQSENGILALKDNGSVLADDPNNPITLILPGGPFCHWIPYPTTIYLVDAVPGEDTNDSCTVSSQSANMTMPIPSS